MNMTPKPTGLAALSHQELLEKCYLEEVGRMRILEAQAAATIEVMERCAEMVFTGQGQQASVVLRQAAKALQTTLTS